MKKIFALFSFILSKGFTKVVKRNNNIWLYGAWFGEKFIDNTKYLFINNNKKNDAVRHIWITKNKQVKQSLNENGYECYLDNSIKGIWLQLRAGIFICVQGVSDFNKFLVNNCTIINLWHGIPLKKIMYDDNINSTRKNTFGSRVYLATVDKNNNEKYVLSTSDKITQIYKNAFRIDENHILQLGQPRNDIFYCDNIVDVDIKRFKNRKTIVYMPTHRQKGKVEININKLFDLQSLNDFCEKNGYIFIIKKHYCHINEKTVGIDKYKYVIDITKSTIDPQILLRNTDILICDYSSAYIDYLLLDRPIIFYNYDIADYVINDREMYFDYDEVTPGVKVENYGELLASLNSIVKTEDKYKLEREKVRNIFYDKNAQCMVSDAIYKRIIGISKKIL